MSTMQVRLPLLTRRSESGDSDRLISFPNLVPAQPDDHDNPMQTETDVVAAVSLP